jgi:hypothetical protein
MTSEYELEAACRDWLKIRPFQDEPTLLRLMDFVRFRERKARIGVMESVLVPSLESILDNPAKSGAK